MEVIVDELRKNNVNIDVETLSEHIQYILDNYRDCYNDSVERLTREELLLDVFHEMNVNQSGADNGLLDACLPHEPYYQRRYSTRQAVRLAAPLIRNVGRVEGSFIRELCSWGRSWVLNLWDIL